MNKDKIITVIDNDGTKKEYELIAHIGLESGNYVVFTDGNVKENGEVDFRVNRLSENENGENIFVGVEDKELLKVMAELESRLK